MFDINAYWQAVLCQDAAALRNFFAPDATIRWHCTNERFTVEEFIAANCAYPGRWQGTIERVEALDDLYISVTCVRSAEDASSFHAVSFLRLVGDKIAAIDEYWGDDGPAPQWRQALRLGQTISR